MNSPFDLSSRTAAVTGALGKLGPVWVETLLEAGAAVAAVDLPGTRPSPRFEQLAARWGGARLRTIRADVTDRASLAEALRTCLDCLGEPSILVNNAGIDQPPAADNRRHHWHEIPAEV